MRDLGTASLEMHHALAAEIGLAPTDLAALTHLAVSPLSHRDLSRKLRLKPASTTTVVDRLVSRGHARRQPRAGDARIVDIYITEAGEQVALRVLLPMIKEINRLQNTRTATDIEIIASFLSDAAQAIRHHLPDR